MTGAPVRMAPGVGPFGITAILTAIMDHDLAWGFGLVTLGPFHSHARSWSIPLNRAMRLYLLYPTC
mgnify:CR=1 FL=1